jgi:hypothetical protein
VSHHPSTAELAAFRRDLNRAAVSDIAGHDIADIAWSEQHPAHGGAWGWEVQNGVGVRVGQHDPGNGWTATVARREASSLRSRAWARNEWAVHPESGGAWWDETEAGLPVHSKCPDGCTLPEGHWGMHPVGWDPRTR